MDQKLEALTRKLYEEGVQKAETEAQRILAQAQKEAEAIRLQAERQAVDIMAQARDESAAIQRRTRSELHMMSTQARERLRQELESLLRVRIVDQPVKEALKDQDLVRRLILDIAGQVQPGTDESLSLALPEETARAWGEAFRQRLQEELGRGLTLHPVPGLKGGFQIGREGQHFRLSFTEEDFQAYLGQFLSREFQDLIHG